MKTFRAVPLTTTIAPAPASPAAGQTVDQFGCLVLCEVQLSRVW